MFSFPVLAQDTRVLSIGAGAQSDYVIEDQLVTPVGPVVVVLKTDPGAELTTLTGSLPASSLIYLKNEGDILGAGGKGGNGGDAFWENPSTHGSEPGAVGLPGGDAINVDVDIVVDNPGSIWGGGGGAGGKDGFDDASESYGGDAGGGGVSGGLGGTGGLNEGPGANGANGTPATTGVAATPGSPGGGDWATAGTTYDAAGGAAGKAIELNGAAITWISGSGAPNVKGTVS